MTGEVGIVVIGRNEGERLVRCLASLKGAGAEIIYVDSGSTDDSVRDAEAAGARVIRLDLSVPFTAARARNAGFAALSGAPEFVQFVDGDCEVADGWISAARRALIERPQTAVVCGRRRERHPTASVFNRLCDDEWATPIGEALACGGDAMFRADAFRDVGGYRERLIAGEEPELCLRLRERGWSVTRIDAEMTLHDADIMRFGQWWRRAVRAGHAFAEVADIHRRSALRIWAGERNRALMWAALAPASLVLASGIGPRALALFLLYPLQIARLGLRRRPPDWISACFLTLAKFAETAGILKYYSGKFRGRASALIEYKA